MPGLVPGIHAFMRHIEKDVDGRVKPGHDDFLVLPGVGPQLAYPLKPAQSNKRLEGQTDEYSSRQYAFRCGPARPATRGPNGVMDALSELGITTLNTPLSPLKVWQAIREAKAAEV